MSERRILLIGPDLGKHSGLLRALEAQSFNVTALENGEHGLTHAVEQTVDVVASDCEMPRVSGLELLIRLRAAKPELPVVLAATESVADTAIEAAKLGVYEYVIKPFETAEFVLLLGAALLHRGGRSKTLGQGQRIPTRRLVGSGRLMQKLYKEIGLAADTDCTVLIRGETGTGKELLARAIHNHSCRSGQPFIAVNCAALSEGLLESELFGHERGAFTGAHSRHIGLFEQANHGTIFLDEIGDLNRSTQVKLLRVLQEREIQRVGGAGPISIDARVLAATHRDLEQAIQKEHFRMDLFFRLNVTTLWAPGLSQHLEDIPELVDHFINGPGAQIGADRVAIEPEGIDFLQGQYWPGNVRQLESVSSQAKVLCRGRLVKRQHFQRAYIASHRRLQLKVECLESYFSELLARAEQGSVTDAYSQMIDAVEREFLKQAVRRSGGNRAKIARWLGITRTTVREKLTLRRIALTQEDKTGSPGEPSDAPPQIIGTVGSENLKVLLRSILRKNCDRPPPGTWGDFALD